MNKNNILKNKLTAYLGAILCTALWGTAFPLIKLGYSSFKIEQNDIASKLLFAGERFALAGVMVFLFGLLIYRKPLLIKKKDIVPIGMLGLVQTTLQYLFAYIGVGFTTASNTSIITGTASIISVILAGIFFKNDRLNFIKIIGCIVGFLGVAIINISDFSLGSITFLGDLIVLLSAISGAGGNIITKKISGNRSSLSITAWQLFLGGLILVLAGLGFGGAVDISKTSGVIILLWLAFVSAISFLLWTALLRYHPVSRITIFTMLVPVFGTIWSGIILGEDVFNIYNVFSLAFISAGIVLVNIRIKRKQNP